MSKNDDFQILLSEAALDMTDIYNYMTSQFKDNTEDCPLVVIVEKLPDRKKAIRLNDKKGVTRVILLAEDKGTEMLGNLYKEITKPTAGEDFPKDCAFYYDRYEVYDLYGVALFIANSIQIPCPQLIYTQNMPVDGVKSLSLPGSGNLTNTIFLKEKEDLTPVIYQLAYEMRHAWQHAKHENLYFGKYQELPENPSDAALEKFQLQKTEIDADAFACRFLGHLLDSKILASKKSAAVNDAINARASKLALPF